MQYVLINNQFSPLELMPVSGEMADQHCFCCKNEAAFRGRLVFSNMFVGKDICNTFCELQLCRRLCIYFPYRQTSPVWKSGRWGVTGSIADHETLQLLLPQNWWVGNKTSFVCLECVCNYILFVDLLLNLFIILCKLCHKKHSLVSLEQGSVSLQQCRTC